MRINPALLLVLLALLVPLVVELRTVAVWVGLDISIGQSLVIGLVLAALLVAWALLPEDRGDGGRAFGPL